MNGQIPVAFYTLLMISIVKTIPIIWFFKIQFDGLQYLCILPVWNYNANSVIQALESLINDSNVSITISNINGLLTLTYNNTFTMYTKELLRFVIC